MSCLGKEGEGSWWGRGQARVGWFRQREILHPAASSNGSWFSLLPVLFRETENRFRRESAGCCPLFWPLVNHLGQSKWCRCRKQPLDISVGQHGGDLFLPSSSIPCGWLGTFMCAIFTWCASWHQSWHKSPYSQGQPWFLDRREEKGQSHWLSYFFKSIVDLQCCVNFRCTEKWISYTDTHIHSFLDSFPIQAIAEYWVEFPVLYSMSLLVIYFIYSGVFMSIPIS